MCCVLVVVACLSCAGVCWLLCFICCVLIIVGVDRWLLSLGVPVVCCSSLLAVCRCCVLFCCPLAVPVC